jgi:hypothetical protein
MSEGPSRPVGAIFNASAGGKPKQQTQSTASRAERDAGF